MTKSASYLRAVLCALLLVACVLVARPFAEMGFGDDFSYIFSARALAQTGHIHYVGWASAMLGWQLALGAFFIKLFGFSFTIVRASTLVVAAITTVLLHRVFVRFGLTERNAVLATLAVMLSPLTFSLAFSFLSDISGVFGTVLATYCCLRALQAVKDQSSSSWLAFAAVATAICGTARQTVWICLFIMVPCAFYLTRQRRRPNALLVAVWLLSLGFVYASLHWFTHQLYSIRELPVAAYIDRDLILQLVANIFRTTFQLSLWFVPLLLAFIPFSPVRNRTAVRVALAFGIPFFLLGIDAVHLHRLDEWLPPVKNVGNSVSSIGMSELPEIGTHVTVVPLWVQLALTLAIAAGLFGFVGFLLRKHVAGRTPQRTTTFCPPTWRQTLILIFPFVMGYLALVLHRALFAQAYDRYFLPLLPLLFAPLVRLYQERAERPQLPVICYVAVSLFALYGVAALHDVYSERRARVIAGQRLVAAGVPRTSFYGGFEYDGWTQIETMGYMNVGYMLLPDGLHVDKPVPRHMVLKPCDEKFAQNVSAIQPRYGISYDQVACDGRSTFAPQPYRTWLPPYDQKLYIRSVTRKVY